MTDMQTLNSYQRVVETLERYSLIRYSTLGTLTRNMLMFYFS